MEMGCCWMVTGRRWSAAGNPGWSVRPRLRNHPKSCGLKQCARNRGREAVKGSQCWPAWMGAWADVRPRVQVGCTWARARLHSKGTGCPGRLCLSSFHPISRAERKRGQCLRAGNATDVRLSLRGKDLLGHRQQAGVPARTHAGTARFAPSYRFLLPFLRGQSSSYRGAQIPLCKEPLPAVSGSSWPSSCSHKNCAQPDSTPHYPLNSQGVSSGAMDMGGRFPSHFPLAEWD